MSLSMKLARHFSLCILCFLFFSSICYSNNSSLEITQDGTVNFNSVVRLKPLANPPQNPVLGDLYLTTENDLRLYVQGRWISISRGYMPGDEINLPYEPTTQQMLERRILERNGASLLRSDYPELFATIGTMYGAVDEQHFNLPDDRGLFIRIWDHGANVDPDAAARTNRGDGITGNNVGTKQGDQFKSHRHSVKLKKAHDGRVYSNFGNGVNGGSTGYTNYSGGSETRPKNRYKWGGIFY